MGFEPTPPKRLVPKTSALDHSATLPVRMLTRSTFYKSVELLSLPWPSYILPCCFSALKINMSLCHLSISCNPKLGANDVMDILLAATSNPHSQLHSVICKGTPLNGCLTTDFIDSVNDKLQHASSLRELVLSGVAKEKTNVDSLTEVWNAKWGQLAQVEAQGHILSLRVKDGY